VTFAQLTDKITIQNWSDPLDRIETVLFADGTRLDVSAAFPNPTLLETSGSTSLVQFGNHYYLDSSSSGTGAELQYNGAAVTVNQFSPTIAPIGVEQTASGYEVVMQDTAAARYDIWLTDGGGNIVAIVGNNLPGNSALLESLEPGFQQDLNGDGVMGSSAVVIESAGSTSLIKAGGDYFLGTTGPTLKWAGAVVTDSTFPGLTPIGTEATATGFEIVVHDTAAAQYDIWLTDGGGNIVAIVGNTLPGNSPVLESHESILHQDLNSDGVTGYAVASAGSLELSGAIAASVQFLGATGTLILDNSSQFSGQVLNFTGSGTPSTSDQLDLKDINANSSSFSHSFNQTTDVLTVSDGTHTAALHFTGSYTAANFKFATDGGSGTIVYDPPASSGNPSLGGASQDAFAFDIPANPVLQMLTSDLHDAIKAEVAGVGGHAGQGPNAEFADVPLPGLEIIENDLHVG
jgi:hypothetical protein